MSAISNITVFDGAAVPVVHTLTAVSVSRETATRVKGEWRETGLAVPTVAQPRLTVTLERLPTGVYRGERRLVIPVMESISGQNASGYTAAPKVAHELTDVRTSFFHERSDVAGRRLIRQMGTNLDNGIATSVTPVTTGPMAELFDLLVAPT